MDNTINIIEFKIIITSASKNIFIGIYRVINAIITIHDFGFIICNINDSLNVKTFWSLEIDSNCDELAIL